jgi:hypothetical protein
LAIENNSAFFGDSFDEAAAVIIEIQECRVTYCGDCYTIGRWHDLNLLSAPVSIVHGNQPSASHCARG